MATAREVGSLPDIELRLSHDEAVVLQRVSGKITGPDTGPRGKMDSIYRALSVVISDREAENTVGVGCNHSQSNLWIHTP